MTVQPDIHHRSHLPYCVPPRHCYWFRNFNRISIDYAFRPRLRYRLTLSRLTLLRKPYVYGARGSRTRYRYLCRQSLFRSLQRSFRSRFTATECSPTNLRSQVYDRREIAICSKVAFAFANHALKTAICFTSSSLQI